MERTRRCGGVSVLRWITDEYWAPLGVWVIRETVRRSLESDPLEFEGMSSMIHGVDSLCGMEGWKGRSRYLTGMVDTSLDSFL
jgi:hypothetical protein